MKEAMKSNDKLRLSTIRMIRSTVKNKEIELRKPLDDGEIQKADPGHGSKRGRVRRTV